MRNLKLGVYGGLAGGLVFGAMMGMLGMLPMIGMRVGFPSVVAGLADSEFVLEKETTMITTNTKYIALTDKNFQTQVLESKQPVLVDFWATWCGPCNTLAPLIDELASDLEGRAKVAKLDIDNNPDTVLRYGIRSIPTLLFFKDGRVVDQVIGVVPKKVIVGKLEPLYDTVNVN